MQSTIDVWKFDVDSGNWTLVFANRENTFNFGASGQFSTSFHPLYRSQAACTTDGDYLYLFGGATGGAGAAVLADDLWMFSFSTGQWAWLHGDATVSGSNNAAYSKVPLAANIPYPRRFGVLHIDHQNCLWVRFQFFDLPTRHVIHAGNNGQNV
jgi:hypothetical protein